MQLESELYESPMKERNQNKYRCNTDSCVCCGKPIKDLEMAKYVHMNTNWMAMHVSIITDDDAEGHGFTSQGYFPIGNDCAKKMGKIFVHTNC